MNALVSMKQTLREQEVTQSLPANYYPYGLQLHLDDATIEKLGLDEEDMQVGKKLYLVARVEVTACSMSDSKEGGEHCSMDVQITHMSLDEADDVDDAADRLYKKS